MAVTPNYSWPVPVNTDYVKDGAEAIKDLGDAIDATVFGLPSGALALINTTTVTAQSTVSFNDVFSATYDNYLILMTLSGGSGVDINYRMTLGGTPNSTASSYVAQRIVVSSTSVNGLRITENKGFIGNIETVRSVTRLEMFMPFKAEATLVLSQNNTALSGGYVYDTHGSHNQAISYDGITIYPSSGTITGNIRVYGYQN